MSVTIPVATEPASSHRHSTSFRLALGYSLLFGMSVLLLFIGVYTGTTQFASQQIRAAIEADIAAFSEHYQRDGAIGLRRLIDRRVNARPTSPELYLLADRSGRVLAGNLSGWPEADVSADGWLSFELGIEAADDDLDPVYRAWARPFALQGGLRLLVGRDIEQLRNLRLRLRYGLLGGLLLTVILALAGGWYLSHRVSRRLERINDACRHIMRGKLNQRIPRDDTRDEFDGLAENMNAMLDRIELAVGDVRRVSDNIAHDLRTPLARLRSRLEMLQTTVVGDDVQQQTAAALEEADGLMETFNALLRIARIEAGERRSGFAMVDLTALAHDVAELYEPVLEQKNMPLRLEVTPNIAVQGDRDLLFQALANLLDNAFKYAPAESLVTLQLAAQGQVIELRIADMGVGIAETERARVVQRFQRLEQSRSSPGVGLGLSLVKAVAELHGGELVLSYADAELGSGLLATLRLPVTC